MDLTTMAIPGFFLFMGVEHVVGRSRGIHVFRGADVLTNLALGTMQVLVGVVCATWISAGYDVLWMHHRWLDISTSSVGAWLALFVGVDFCYYWFHRAAHRVNLAWASHAPHHSSEDYNLAVALRQGPLQPLFSMFFYLPLALVGFPPAMFVTMVGLNTLYQFWIHTELIGRLGPLDRVLNTPSNHRVHHGCNGRYIDRNHGGILIIWDRIFGTFEPEEDRPVYGTVKQVATWNPLRAACAPFWEILQVSLAAPGLFNKLRVWLMPPEWRPAGMSRAVDDVYGRAKFDARVTRSRWRYANGAFNVTLLVAIVFLVAGAPTFSWLETMLASLWFVVSFASVGGLLDSRPWASSLEVARIFVLGPSIVSLIASGALS